MSQKPKLLIVDDVESNLFTLRRVIEKIEVDIIEAQSGPEALEKVSHNDFFLIMMDVQMPEMDGFETATQIFANNPEKNIPIIFVTGVGKEERYMAEGYKTGAVDYMFKPLDAEIVRAKVHIFLNLYIQQRKLIDTQEELKRSNTELDAFAYAASHDLRSPLRGIANLATFLEEDAGDLLPVECQKYIEDIKKRISDMNQLMDTLLQYASIGNEEIMREEVSLQSCLDKALRALDVEIQEKKAHVEVDPLPQVQANPTWIAQLFQNLISNALKFVQDKEPHIRITATQNEEGAFVFGLHDNGIGIEEKNRERIFQPFKFLNHKYKFEGSGIGLSTCMKIVTRHKGRLWVESKGLGEGSSFYFTLNE